MSKALKVNFFLDLLHRKKYSGIYYFDCEMMCLSCGTNSINALNARHRNIEITVSIKVLYLWNSFGPMTLFHVISTIVAALEVLLKIFRNKYYIFY